MYFVLAENWPAGAAVHSRQPCLLFVPNSGWTFVHNSSDWHHSVCVRLQFTAVFQRGKRLCRVSTFWRSLCCSKPHRVDLFKYKYWMYNCTLGKWLIRNSFYNCPVIIILHQVSETEEFHCFGTASWSNTLLYMCRFPTVFLLNLAFIWSYNYCKSCNSNSHPIFYFKVLCMYWHFMHLTPERFLLFQ